MDRLFTNNELSSQDFLDFKDEKYVVSYLSSAASLVAHLVKNLPAMHMGRAQPLLQTLLLLIFLELLSTRRELNCFPWWAWGSPSTSYLKITVISIYKVEGSTRKHFKQMTLKDESFLKLRLTQSSNFH